MLNIGICDDLKHDRCLLIHELQRYCSAHFLSPVFHEFENGESLLAALKDCPLDLIFLDYYMDGLTGGEIAAELKRQYPELPIVFVTTSAEPALECYDYEPLHYLCKPFSPKRIAEVFDRFDALHLRRSRYISVMVDKVMRPVALNDLIYAEVMGRVITLHLCGNVLLKTYKTMRSLEHDLSGEDRFCRCHQSFMVNFDYVFDETPEAFVLKDGSRVPIRQRTAAAIRKAYADYVFKRLRA